MYESKNTSNCASISHSLNISVDSGGLYAAVLAALVLFIFHICLPLLSQVLF